MICRSWVVQIRLAAPTPRCSPVCPSVARPVTVVILVNSRARITSDQTSSCSSIWHLMWQRSPPHLLTTLKPVPDLPLWWIFGIFILFFSFLIGTCMLWHIFIFFYITILFFSHPPTALFCMPIATAFICMLCARTLLFFLLVQYFACFIYSYYFHHFIY